MKRVKHTLLPWREHTHQTVVGSHLIVNELGDVLIARCGKENAAFIVTACNAHYELLGALKDMRSRFWSCISDGNGEVEGDKEALALADTAIAKVTETAK